jgi:hypothetical protein
MIFWVTASWRLICEYQRFEVSTTSRRDSLFLRNVYILLPEYTAVTTQNIAMWSSCRSVGVVLNVRVSVLNEPVCWRCMGKWRYSTTHTYSRWGMEVSVQLHLPVRFISSERAPRSPFVSKFGGPNFLSGHRKDAVSTCFSVVIAENVPKLEKALD